MTCGVSTSRPSAATLATRGFSEVGVGPEHVHLTLHGPKNSDRLANEEARVGDDEDRQHDLQAAREAWAPPEIRERKGTEDQEEQDQDPHWAVVPRERGGRLSGAHDSHSAPRRASAPEEDDDQ